MKKLIVALVLGLLTLNALAKDTKPSIYISVSQRDIQKDPKFYEKMFKGCVYRTSDEVFRLTTEKPSKDIVGAYECPKNVWTTITTY